MPYFVYRIHPPSRLEQLERFDDYQPARQATRSLRAAQSPASGATIRMIFAGGPGEAERLLTEKREPRALGEE